MLLARTREGYANISRLFTLANAADRREPRLDPARLAEHAGGVVLLTGGRDGPLSKLLSEGRREDAGRLLRAYLDWYGPDGVYVELQQNFLKGDTARNRELAELARSAGVPLGRLQRRPLPLPGPVQAPARAGGSEAQHHHRAGPALHQAQRPPVPEAPGPHEGNLPPLPRGRRQHRQDCGAVRVQLGHRLGLLPARVGRAPGLHRRRLPAAALLRGRPETLRLRCPGWWRTGWRRSSGSSSRHGLGRVPAALPGDRAAGAGDHGGEGSASPGNSLGGAPAGPGPGLLGGPAGQATSSASATWTP